MTKNSKIVFLNYIKKIYKQILLQLNAFSCKKSNKTLLNTIGFLIRGGHKIKFRLDGGQKVGGQT